ncbi:TlpA disulfide reductase family protein [uncultured Sunxiuqinia sp.]|uniref:TlpA family protein disulfide reductase n=1 Tax=uncultured Sunxiuqinia sp. TaxID=1573825 RepID=UPI0026028179|nr:TlpA disulfide reductase family protein [uncultured Sunxiuqinia sp.]
MNLSNILKSLVVVFCFFISCTVENSPEKVPDKSNQIVLIFKSPPSKWKVHRKAGGYTTEVPTIEFIDDHFIHNEFIPNSEKGFDTLIIKTQRDFLELRHSYKAHDKLSYLFQNGDSVVFTYRDKTPMASVVNRATKTHDTNLDLLKREAFYPNDYPSFIRYRNPFMFMENSDNLQKEHERIKASANEKLFPELNQEISLIDSLYEQDLISEENYKWSKTGFIYQKKRIELYRLLGDSRRLKGGIPNLTKEDFNIQLENEVEMRFVDGGNILDRSNDSLLYYGFQKDMIDWIHYYHLRSKVGRISSTHYINGVASAGSSIPDLVSLYDSIQSCSMLSQQTKNILKFETIQEIIENYTIDEAKKALNRFKTDVPDSALIGFINNKYALSTDLNQDSYDMKLSSFHAENTTFNALLKKHEDKVIYLDFWSSACPPCIRQFKHAKSLEELYRDKDLVLVYISSEPNRASWEKMCKRFDITRESYLVSNRFTSKQLEDMNVKYIPHYMIFDRKGKLVVEAAPRPEDKSLIKELDRYLAED